MAPESENGEGSRVHEEGEIFRICEDLPHAQVGRVFERWVKAVEIHAKDGS